MRYWGEEFHVAQWPTHDLPAKDRIRPIWLWDNQSKGAVDPNTGEFIPYTETSQFIREITKRRLYILVYRIADRHYFSILEELLDDKRVKPAGLTRTGGFFGLYIKSRLSAWIVERRVWDDGVVPPNSEFCTTLANVWNINHRCAATPGSLGERKIRETLPKGTRYNRPSCPLRKVLLANKTGGRSDTIEEKKHYGVLYQEDLNSAYPAMSVETIDPAEHPIRFGSRTSLSTCDRILTKFFSYYARCVTSLPRSVPPVKFGPLASRDKNGRLRWPTVPGVIFEGWYWKEELDRARDAGYQIEVYEGYGWKRSSRWLEKWAKRMYRLKVKYKGTPEGDIIKRETVAAIGRFGMSPEKLTLVDHYEKGDIPVAISNAYADESPTTKWFIHVEPDLDNNSLTHIASYIVMKGRVALYDRVIANTNKNLVVVATNYDSIYLRTPPKLRHGKGLGGWKCETIYNAYIHAPRSISGDREDGHHFDKRPGVKRSARSP